MFLLCFFLFPFSLLLFLIAPGKGCMAERQAFRHRNIAHRGLHTKDRRVPENSLSAFRAACKAGYGIELDIRLTKDDKIVVFHDATLSRVCGIEGTVISYTYQELSCFSLAGTTECIPLFSDVLKLIDGQVPLVIELKSGSRNRILCQKCFDLLQDYSGIYCIESFDPFLVRWFKKHAPTILRGQLSAPAKKFSGIAPRYQAYLLSHLFSNCLARPHFIAYYKRKSSPFVYLTEVLGAMWVVWTIHKEDNHLIFEQENDSVIFEFYNPAPFFTKK